MSKSKRWIKEKLLDDSHPHWIYDADGYICSVCGSPVIYPMSQCTYCKSNMMVGRRKDER